MPSFNETKAAVTLVLLKSVKRTDEHLPMSLRSDGEEQLNHLILDKYCALWWRPLWMLCMITQLKLLRENTEKTSGRDRLLIFTSSICLTYHGCAHLSFYKTILFFLTLNSGTVKNTRWLAWKRKHQWYQLDCVEVKANMKIEKVQVFLPFRKLLVKVGFTLDQEWYGYYRTMGNYPVYWMGIVHNGYQDIKGYICALNSSSKPKKGACVQLKASALIGLQTILQSLKMWLSKQNMKNVTINLAIF